ncbi:MAG: ribonuclease HII [Chloroflexota bacterium]|nr:ribonuclease HII [Chloroflexota bacterium]
MNAQPRPSLQTERELWQAGYHRVAGLDEAGRGAWAGPVYAAAVLFPQFEVVPEALAGVRDSKLLSARQREVQFERIVATALTYGVGFATAEEIDQQGIVPGTQLAMHRALAQLGPAAQALIIDALQLPTVRLPQRSFPHADALSLTVAAASILAKVSRDHWMAGEAATRFPGYGFAQHKGYGTVQHRTALDKLGVSAIHRCTFRPVAARLR